MSKIVIKEFDKTTAGINTTYSNFSVVVPGFVGKELGKELIQKADGCWYCGDIRVFDENGIYECSDQNDFEAYVGLTNYESSEATPASACEAISLKGDEEEGWTIEKGVNVYTREVITDEADQRIGYLRDSSTNDGTGKTEYHKYSFKFKSDGEGIFHNEEYYKLENLGADAVEKQVAHYGNKMAYYLLGLGYTVLYVMIKSLQDLNSSDLYAPLRDKASYDFRYIVNGLLNNNSEANKAIAKIASYSNTSTDENRGDCIALLDADIDYYKELYDQNSVINGINNAINAVPLSDDEYKCSAFLANPVEYEIETKQPYRNSLFPTSFHYLACAMSSMKNFAEWYAVSGYTRGKCSWKVKSTFKRLGEVAIQALQPRNSDNGVSHAVNLAVKVKNEFYLWGNRTAYTLGNSKTSDLKASHFLNIRQLCTTIKKQIYDTCRRYTFDPNTDTLWFNFYSEITPLLERMKADQGIRNYSLYKVKSAKKAKLCAVLRIVPVEAVEDFEINMYLEDSISGELNLEFVEIL